MEAIRSLVLAMVRRRLARASEARPSAIRGSEEGIELRRPRRGRRGASGGRASRGDLMNGFESKS